LEFYESLFVLSCIGRGLEKGRSPIQAIYMLLANKLRNPESGDPGLLRLLEHRKERFCFTIRIGSELIAQF
jgi:hypothetical protein